MTRAASFALLVAVVGSGCGDNLETVPDEILPYSVYEARCESPRTGQDPDGNNYPDRRGTKLDEQLWVRSWLDDLYLWYPELPKEDPRDYGTAVEYFDAMKTPRVTPSGRDKDRFHFSYDTAYWDALSESGVEPSFGVQWVLIRKAPPRKIVVAYTQPDSPGAAAGLERGAEVLTIDGVDVENGADTVTLNGGLAPQLGASHTFVVRDAPGAEPRTVTMTAAALAIAPVINARVLDAPNDHIGYLTFTDHIATAEKALADAIVTLRDRGITELVLDMRYNGGGYLYIAGELAYMIAGPERTAGRAFERRSFNDRYGRTDPFTGSDDASPFYDKAVGFSLPFGQQLPTLNLNRVFVLTGPGTCSASEAVMNGLAGIGVEVIQIGTTTCGKPYGFYPAENCGTTYFAIQFEGVNDQGFGDYADGFTPGGVLPGCVVEDDFRHDLGDPAEARLSAALAYAATSTCPALRTDAATPSSDGEVLKPAWRQNRIMTR